MMSHDLQVQRVQVLGEERYLVGHTPHTLLLGDLASCKLSEVRPQSLFSFMQHLVCMGRQKPRLALSLVIYNGAF